MFFDTDPVGCSDALSRLSAIGFCEELVRSRLGFEGFERPPIRERLPSTGRNGSSSASLWDLAIDLLLLQGTLPASELDRLFNASDQEAFTRRTSWKRWRSMFTRWLRSIRLTKT